MRILSPNSLLLPLGPKSLQNQWEVCDFEEQICETDGSGDREMHRSNRFDAFVGERMFDNYIEWYLQNVKRMICDSRYDHIIRF